MCSNDLMTTMSILVVILLTLLYNMKAADQCQWTQGKSPFWHCKQQAWSQRTEYRHWHRRRVPADLCTGRYDVANRDAVISHCSRQQHLTAFTTHHSIAYWAGTEPTVGPMCTLHLSQQYRETLSELERTSNEQVSLSTQAQTKCIN